MPDYRPAIDRFILSQPYQEFVAHPHPHAMKTTFRHSVEAVQRELNGEFDSLQRRHAEAVAAKARLDAMDNQVKQNNMSWDGLGEDFDRRYYEANDDIRSAMMWVELGAEHILLTLDGLVTNLVFELTNNEWPIDVGALVVGTVRFDRLLDAAGNFIRHRWSWLRAVRQPRELEPRERRSIEPLAQALSGNPTLIGNDAAQFLMEAPQPMLALLDIFADYLHRGERSSYDTIHNRCVDLGSAIIDARFAEWFERHRAAGRWGPFPEGGKAD